MEANTLQYCLEWIHGWSDQNGLLISFSRKQSQLIGSEPIGSVDVVIDLEVLFDFAQMNRLTLGLKKHFSCD